MDSCQHTSSIVLDVVYRKVRDPSTWTCNACESNTESVWICLQCAHVGCGRTCKHKHAMKHFRETAHSLALHINQKSLYCYSCGDYVLCDNARGEVELIRSELRSLQDQVYEASTTRSGSLFRTQERFFSFVDRTVQHEVQDKSFTLRKQYESMLYRSVFRQWRIYISNRKQCYIDKQDASLVSNVSTTTTHTISNKRLRDSMISPALHTTMLPNRFHGRTGLRNIGNTCYQNATLTSLSSLCVFRSFVETLPQLHQYTRTRDLEPSCVGITSTELESTTPIPIARLPVARRSSEVIFEETQRTLSCAGRLSRNAKVKAKTLLQQTRSRRSSQSSIDVESADVVLRLYQLLRIMWCGKWAGVTPISFVRSFVSKVPQFRGYKQHDAHEFLIALLDILDTELQLIPLVSCATATSATSATTVTSATTTTNATSATSATTVTSATTTTTATSATNTTTTTAANTNPTTNNNTTSLHHLSTKSLSCLTLDQSVQFTRSFITRNFESIQVSSTRCHRCNTISQYRFPGALAITLDLPFTLSRLRQKLQHCNATTTRRSLRTSSANASHRIWIQQQQQHQQRQSSSNKSIYQDVCTLNHLLNDLVAPVTLNEASQYQCATCSLLTDATKTDSFSSLSNVIVFHINRTKWDAYGKSKVQHKVTFPLRNLDLSILRHEHVINSQSGAYAADDNTTELNHSNGRDEALPINNLPFIGEHKTTSNNNDVTITSEDEGVDNDDDDGYNHDVYDLRACVVHHGHNVDEGHYTSVCRSGVLASWVAFNDLKAQLIAEDDLINHDGDVYLLFYERRHLSK